ncbi:unnamed protein product [Mucor circinelloides]
MATKEDRYPKEYKPFPNDKPISSSQGSNNSSSHGAGSSSGRQQPDFRDALKSTISRHMKGFRATNVITYKRFRDKSTWQRPGEFAELVATDDEDAFTADPKEAWPIMQDMNIDIPVRDLTKQHRVVDRNWTVPVSNKKFKQPEPVYPQSTGVKLRNVEDIMNDYSKKAPPQATTNAQSLSLSASSNANKSLTPTTNSIPRVADKSQRPLQLIPDRIKGVLQNLTDTRRKPISTASTPSKSHGNMPSSNTPRKSSALKSSTISPQDPKIKKQSTPSTTTATTAKSANAQSRPRVSSKTIPMEKVTQIENIPDLMEARKYLIGHDEVEFRSLSSLQEMPKNAQVEERPQLFFRLYPKPDENDMPKGLKQHIASVNNIKIKKERAASVSSTKKNQTKKPTHSKSTTTTTTTITTSLPLEPSTKSAGETNIEKKSQSDPSQAPIRTSATKSKKPTNIKEEEEEATTIKSSEKQAYTSSVSAEFLRSTKIPKRSNSINKSSISSHDMELEEGETISPSPSPIRTKSRSSHTDVDDESSGTDRSAASGSTSRKLSTISAMASTPVSTTSTTSKRRGEEKSSREREKDRDRHRDESISSSRRERNHRRKSRSRSRSPVSKSHRSESKSRRSSPPPPSARRQASSESSHRRRSPAARPERESSRSEKESVLASITTANVNASTRSEKETVRSNRESSRPEKESTSSTSRAERSDREKDSSGRDAKRKSFHDASESKSSTSEPPTKRLSTTKTNKDEKSSYTNTNTTPTATIEKDTKYTSNSNPVSNSSSSTSKNAKKSVTSVASTPKSVSTPNAATTTTTTQSSNTTVTAANVPEKIISATAPNAETPEQLKIFTIMFKQLAHANKRRGDSQKDPVIGIIDHFHALCDYMLNFYFIDKVNTNVPFKQASVAWKSLFPFSDSLLLKLQANHLHELYGLCVRLVALIRYYIYSRMESATRPLLTKHLSGSGSQDSNYTDRTCIEMTEGLLREHEKAEKCYKESEKYMTFGKVASQFPGTFKDVCIDGNILAGITLGGEAGVSVGPMFPFTPYSPLHHAAIVSKCILNEYVTKNNLSYSPITKPEEFM